MPEQYNPAIGSAAGFASDAARNYEAGLDFVTRLRAAAQQQQQHDDLMRQESFKNQLELAGKGAVPLTQDPTGGTIAKGGLGVRTADNPAAQGVTGMTVTDPTGRQFKVPDASQKAADKLTDANSFTLTDKLRKQAGAMGEALAPDQRYPLSMLEHINQAIERERAATERTTEFQTRDKERLDTESEREKDRQDARTESARRYAQTEKDRQDARTESTRRYEEGRADRAQRLAETQQAAQDRKDAKAQAGRDSAQKTIDRLQAEEQKHHQLAQGYGDALKQPDGSRVIDPKTNKPIQMDKAQTGGGIFSSRKPYEKGPVRLEFERRYQESVARIQQLQKTQRQLVQQNGGGDQPNIEAGTPGGPGGLVVPPNSRSGSAPPEPIKPAPAKAAPAKATPKPGSAGKTTIGTVQRYAKKNKLTLSEAVKQVEAEGYAIQGQ